MSGMGILRIFEDDYWNRNMDPRLKGFPMMEDGFPWKMISISLVYLLIVKFWNPKFRHVDLRPYLLIQNGIFFGCHGAGIVIGFLLSDMGRDCFDCSDLKIIENDKEMNYEYIKSQTIIYLATVLLYLRMFMMTETVVLKIMTGKQPSIMRSLNDISMMTYTFLGTKYLPGGPLFFFAITYVCFYTFTYGYYTLRCGYNTNNNDYSLVLRWKKIFIGLMFLWSFLLLFHSVFLSVTTSCRAHNNIEFLTAMQVFYAVGTFANASNAVLKLRKSHWD